VGNFLKFFLFILLILAIALFYKVGGHEYLSFKKIQAYLISIQAYHQQRPWNFTLIFITTIITLISLSIPGTIVLTILAGSIYGAFLGTFLVCLATTMGSSISFSLARFIFKDFLEKRFIKQFNFINNKVRENAIGSVLTLRLVPALPLILINMIMGLTKIRLITFVWVSYAGLIPGTFIYVYAGRRLSELDSIEEILSWPLIIGLLSLGLVPYVFKFFVSLRSNRKQFI
jgi:uncharacterized membrane protein YdjX (TVP38/TMEM64 family)